MCLYDTLFMKHYVCLYVQTFVKWRCLGNKKNKINIIDDKQCLHTTRSCENIINVRPHKKNLKRCAD